MKARDMMKEQQRDENAAQVITILAGTQAEVGKCVEAKANIANGLALSRGRGSLTNAAIAAAICNDTAQAQSYTDEMTKLYPNDTGISIAIPMIKAVLELKKQNPSGALQTLETLRRYEFGLLAGAGPTFLRGHCYLQQGMGKEAAAEFEKVIAHSGVDILSIQHPLAQLGLARASVITGDTAKARKAYQDFLALWKDADQDVGVLVAAKKEYEQLK
jgi:tetratricopeptide (TPR) repeat protein